MYKYKLKRQEHDHRDFLFAQHKPAEKGVPEEYDLRQTMPGVFDQLELGSCSANSTSAALMHLLFYKQNKPYKLLSRLYQYYKTREMEGTANEDSGCTNRDAALSTVKNGICEEEFDPYIIQNFTVKPSVQADQNAVTHKAFKTVAIRTLQELKESIGVHQIPVIIGMEVFESFESEQVAKTGIMTMPVIGEQNFGGHSVLAVGYTKTHIICRNSWGTGWGQGGYFLMPYEYFRTHTWDYWIVE